MHVTVFDLHLWKRCQVEAADVTSALQDLVEGASRASFSASGKMRDIGQLRVFSVGHASDRSRFWRKYANIVSGEPVDTGGCLLPVRCRPKSFRLTFAALPTLTVNAFATIWLWPFGWASSLEL
jgi:hypothetical protein